MIHRLTRVLAAASLFLNIPLTFAVERVLVADGRSDYEIVCASGANPATMLAAKELRHWIKESSGINLAQVAVPSANRKHLFIGANEWSARAGVSLATLRPEGYRLITIGDDVHIAGIDVHRGSLEPKRASATQTGTLSGVYDFLARCFEIRFLWHDQLGTLVPKRDRVIVPDLAIETSPLWTYRYLAYSPEGKCGDDIFARRLGLGHSYTVTHSHSWHQIAPVEKYGPAHPEWFAEIDGKRKPEYYLERHGGQVCTTNAEVIELFANAAIAFFNEHPTRDMFSVSPNDGSGFCTCGPCRALDPAPRPDGRPIITDRLITFYNAIAERVAKAHPTKLLGAYAYSYYRTPPEKVRPHPNLYLVHATNSAFQQGFGWPEEHAMEKQWRAGARHLAKYDIYFSPDSSLNLIAPVTRHLVEKVRAESRVGIEGGYLYVGQSYEQLGAAHVMLARLMWNPDVDTDKIATEYYRALYGAAAPHVQAYYDLLESRLIQARAATLDTKSPAIRVALRAHPGPGSPAYILTAYQPILDQASKLMGTALASELDANQKMRLQRLNDQHELLTSTVRGMFVAARLESDADSNVDDARALLDFIRQRELARDRIKKYAPSLIANLALGDKSEAQALAPDGPLAHLARLLVAPRKAGASTKFFPQGDFEGIAPDRLSQTYRWAGAGDARIELETTAPRSGKHSLRIHVPEGGSGAITFTRGVSPNTSYRILLDHWNDPMPIAAVAGDDADAVTRGEPAIAPRTRVIFRGEAGAAAVRNQWSGLGASEHQREWHTFPQLIQTPPQVKNISFTIFLRHPGTYLIDNVKIEELGEAKP